jgi:hypothetical protein
MLYNGIDRVGGLCYNNVCADASDSSWNNCSLLGKCLILLVQDKTGPIAGKRTSSAGKGKTSRIPKRVRYFAEVLKVFGGDIWRRRQIPLIGSPQWGRPCLNRL